MAAKVFVSPPLELRPSFLGRSLENRTSTFHNLGFRNGLSECSLAKSLQFSNGRLCTPNFKDNRAPDFSGTQYVHEMIPKPVTRLCIFSGTANPSLSQEVASYMGLELGKINIKRFADGEIYVQLQESVRGCDVFLVQPTCPPANENLMELLIMIDACRRASARTITAVIPYFGYARADRKTQGRESIAAKLVANMITEAGAHRVLSCDFHSGQAMGYFDIPVDHIYGQVMNLIGDVKGKVAVMVDDMIDTAGTIASAAALLQQEGARAVYACCTHAVFSPPAIERLSGGLFQEVIITNTIPVAEQNYFPQLTVLSVANLLGETIWRVHDDGSVSSIFL
ncbi:ribose-phosphate pyrophosphokinase 1, chloroplastic-like isoform X2 [Tasmannia lanceolata]|uniref:ribose-phosphate pyrophosphokinase 1, chloroplastic-like isoform X2 n=1 Tax=Tasmannia lanceolata TaxID=3420 RepID=UPI004063E534